MKNNSGYFRAVASVVGFIVGAGIFGVAFSWSKSGFFVGFAELATIAVVVILAHLMFGEIILRTNGRHRLPGLARLYLGQTGERVAFFSNVLGALGALLAYTIIGGTFLWQLAGTVIPLGQTSYQLLFFFVMGVLAVAGLRIVSKIELILTGFLLLTVLFIVAMGAPYIKIENFFLEGDVSDLFLPFGVLIFSLSGWAAIPEARDILEKNSSKIKSAIIWGSLIAAFITAIFASSVLGISGKLTTEEAIFGLYSFLGYGIVIAGAIFGVLAIATSFLVLGIYTKETLEYDFKIPKGIAGALTLGIPLGFFLIGARSFINVISVTGGVFGAIDVVLIVLTYRAARVAGKRKPEYALGIPGFALWIIAAAFAAGAVYEIARIVTF